jgi:hypothetical protein
MPVTPFVAPELFDRLLEYASKVERDKELSSAPTDFCDNFYAQFFQNRIKQEITGFGNAAKESAVKLRLKMGTREAQEIVLLITCSNDTAISVTMFSLRSTVAEAVKLCRHFKIISIFCWSVLLDGPGWRSWRTLSATRSKLARLCRKRCNQ